MNIEAKHIEEMDVELLKYSMHLKELPYCVTKLKKRRKGDNFKKSVKNSGRLFFSTIHARRRQVDKIQRVRIEVNDPQHAQWSAIYAGPNYYYGCDAGPVARRAIRYSRPLSAGRSTPSALDVGCGEGQDLAFLCESGYRTTGLDFVPDATQKAQQLLRARGLQAQLHTGDLRDWSWGEEFELVLAVNSLQFLGNDAPAILGSVMQSVAVGGVLGLSLFACESGSAVRDGVFFISLEELLNDFDYEGNQRRWQMLETTKLWQWNARENAPQPFVTLIAQRLK